MKKLLWLFCFVPTLGWGWGFGSGGSVDYSRDAGNSFYCASTGTVTTQAGISVSSPTWALYNPPNSTKNLVVLDVGIDVMASPAAAAEFLLAYSTAVTPSTSTVYTSLTYGIQTPAVVGKSTTTATGICVLQAGLPATPTAFRYIGGTTGASAIGGVVFTDQTQGKVVVPPGYVISIQASSAAAIRSHVLWREDNL